MNRRKAAFLAVAFLGGVAAVEYRLALLWCILFLYGLVWVFAMGRAYGKSLGTVFWVVVFLAVVVLGGYDSYSRQVFRERYASKLDDGEKCFVQGEIYQKEKENHLFYLKNCRLQLNQQEYSCNHILLNLEAEKEYFIGEILCIKGTIKMFAQPSNEGSYDERGYYQSLKIDFGVDGESVLSVHGKKNVFREWLCGLKEKMKESFEIAMPDADAGVLAAMTLGDKSLMDKERKAMYQNAGVSHFYSISGLHISLLGMALYHFLRKYSGSYLVSGGIAAAFILGYGELIGFGISASRAIGMFLLLLYAKYRGRSYDRITSLALLAALLAGENPGLLHHVGYLLSFGAVAGVILAEWVLSRRNLEKNEEIEDPEKEKRCFLRMVKWMQETFLVSCCIQLTTTPMMCSFFYEISIYAVFVNLVILPCMGVLLGLGIAGGITGCFFPFVGKLLLYPCYLILLLFDGLCESALKLPCASLITGKLPFVLLLFWYGIIFIYILLKNQKKKLPVFLMFLPFCMLLPVEKQRAFEIDILDVGQGDGIYLSAGDGTRIFIDGGSTDVSKVGIYRILPFLKCRGIRQIDYWFVSHCDADHISGLMEVMEAGYKIKNLMVSKFMPEDEAWQELKELAEQKHIRIQEMNRGDAVKGKNHDWSIQSLSSGKLSATADRNENSLVLLFQSKDCLGFFAGDIGEAQEKALAEEWDLPKIDVYKASHHGSKTSNCGELLNEIQPEIAVISCSIKNRYGHPGKETLERLEEADSRIYETRYLGQIKIKGVHLESEVASMLEYIP